MSKYVRCIKDINTYLTLNKIYLIEKESDAVYFIIDDKDQQGGYAKHRFIELNAPEEIK